MIDPELLEALKRVAAANPELSEGAVLRQALREWFDRHGVAVKKKKTDRPRGVKRASSPKRRQQR